ncbi:hypothetical protein ABKN59_008574 [Abortiporus biennis]
MYTPNLSRLRISCSRQVTFR